MKESKLLGRQFLAVDFTELDELNDPRVEEFKKDFISKLNTEIEHHRLDLKCNELDGFGAIFVKTNDKDHASISYLQERIRNYITNAMDFIESGLVLKEHGGYSYTLFTAIRFIIVTFTSHKEYYLHEYKFDANGAIRGNLYTDSDSIAYVNREIIHKWLNKIKNALKLDEDDLFTQEINLLTEVKSDADTKNKSYIYIDMNVFNKDVLNMMHKLVLDCLKNYDEKYDVHKLATSVVIMSDSDIFDNSIDGLFNVIGVQLSKIKSDTKYLSSMYNNADLNSYYTSLEHVRIHYTIFKNPDLIIYISKNISTNEVDCEYISDNVECDIYDKVMALTALNKLCEELNDNDSEMKKFVDKELHNKLDKLNKVAEILSDVDLYSLDYKLKSVKEIINNI